MKRVLKWAPVVLGVIFLAALGYHRREIVLRGENDFVAFYSGAKLAGTTLLYNRDANIEISKRVVGRDMKLQFVRPPFYAVLLKPLAMLPFLYAYGVFTLLSLAGYIWFVARFQTECEALPFLAAISIPYLAGFMAGQDSPLLMVILGLAILLLRKNEDFAAGLVLSLCAFKPHLFMLIPVLILVKKRWKMAISGAIGTAFLMLVGEVVNGFGSTAAWIRTIRDPWINPDASGMPNLHGIAAMLGGGWKIEAVLAAATVLLFLAICLSANNFELLFAASLIGSLLLSVHAMIDDELILFPVLVLVLASSRLLFLRVLAGLILTPIPYFLVLAGPPYVSIFPAALIAMLGAVLVETILGLRGQSSTKETASRLLVPLP